MLKDTNIQITLTPTLQLPPDFEAKYPEEVAKLKQDFEKLKESSNKYIILPSDEICNLPTLTVNDACTWIGMKYGQGAIMEFTDWWFDGKKVEEDK